MKKILLIAGLAALSWMSTYTGMLELVQANLGDLDLVFKIAIGASVAMLMLMVVWLLDQLFHEGTRLPVRILYVAGYLFLTLISVGFSFGFYWKFLESRSEASRGAESAVTQVQTSLHGAETRLAQMQSVFDQLAAVSTQKAQDESTKGNSCPNSRPGDGPRRRLRDSDAASFSTASQFVQQRSSSIKGDIAALDADLQKIVHQDKSTFDVKTGTRNEFIKGLGRKLEMTVAGFNAFRTDPQLKQLRADFAERADKTTFPDDAGKTFSCPDAQIQASLHSAVKTIDALPQLEKPEIVTVEGADATIEAFRRLNVTLLSLVQFKLPATPDQIRAQQTRAVQTGGADLKPVSEAEAGLSQRDYIPLAIALFVDLCLLLVSIPKPMSTTERTRRRRAKSDGEIYRTLDDLYAIHDDPDARAKMEPLRHIAFDYMGHDYVAVPLIATREGAGGDHDGSARNLADDDMLEAQFIANFFASQESGGPFKRASFPPTSSVKARLKKLGSKWAGIQSFRVYRFNKNAWSDFVLDMVVGADHELTPVREKQLEARLKKNEMKSNQIVFESELKKIEHDAVKEAKTKEAALNTQIITDNIEEREYEAKLRREEKSAQSKLKLMGLEANIAAKQAEIERTRREIARSYDDLDAGQLHTADGFELRNEPGAPRKSGLFDKLFGTKDGSKDDAAGPAEPTLERKSRRVRTVDGAPIAMPTPSPDIAALRDTVSELAIIMRELATHQASQMSLAARTAAAAGGSGQAGPTGQHRAANLNAEQTLAAAIGKLSPDRSSADRSPSDRNQAEPFGAYRPGHANGHDLHPSDFGSASAHAAAHAGANRVDPDFAPRPEDDATSQSSVIYMPGPVEPRLYDGASRPGSQSMAAGGAHINRTAALETSPAVPMAGGPRWNRDSAPEFDGSRATGTVRFPEAFRWAAESTMTGGVHQIDQPIEPLVPEVTATDTLLQDGPDRGTGLGPDWRPDWRPDWHPERNSERNSDWQPSHDLSEHSGQPNGHLAPDALPPVAISSTTEITSFLSRTRSGNPPVAEPANGQPSQGHEQIGDDQIGDELAQFWQSAPQDAHNGPGPETFGQTAETDREEIEIERIATKFGRGGSRRRRGN